MKVIAGVKRKLAKAIKKEEPISARNVKNLLSKYGGKDAALLTNTL